MSKRDGNWVDYEERLRRVLTYIHKHLEEDIDLNLLAEVACLSPYHWHRVYRAIQGETIAATIRRLRLHHAAGRLANSEMPVDDIAKRAGYGSVHAFSRAFSANIGMPPAAFRKTGNHMTFKLSDGETGMSEYTVDIRDMPAMRLATIPHKGAYMEIGRAFDQLYGWFGSRNLMGPGTRMIGIYFDDPDTVPEAELNSRAGIVVDNGFAMDAPLQEYMTRAGTHAVLTYKGPYAGMKSGYDWLYGSWLAQSGREPADAPCIEEYLNNPGQVPASELLTEICLPLR